MKIAFVGKGGSGKTTLASLFTAHLVAGGQPALAIDADINQHLAEALGATEAQARSLPALGDHLPLIKDYLRGTNPLVPSADAMIKTTPPGTGSRLLRVVEDNPIYEACVRRVGDSGVRLAVTGPFSADDVGVACYHGKVGATELLLSYMVDGPSEYVVVDMTAGADSFASGLFTRFDLVVVVCEPTLRSVGVYDQVSGHASEYGIQLVAVGNKVQDDADVEFLTERIGGPLMATVGRSDHVRAAERGDIRPIEELEADNRKALKTIKGRLDAVDKDWAAYQQQAVDFHVRNATAWGNERTGRDLTEQIDPTFVLGPASDVSR